MPATGRTLTLLSLLQSRRDWPGGLLAERLEVSERTVRRDVERLRELGYRIRAIKGPDGGYRLDAGTDLPPLLFDDEQAVALAVALQTATAGGDAFAEGALRAFATVRQLLPARLRVRVDAVQVAALPGRRERSAPVVDPDALAALSAAVRAFETVRFDYGDASDDTASAARPPRRAEPYGVVTAEQRWYLLAFDLDRDDWRVFRVDRMHLRSHAGARFRPREVPGGDVRAFVAGRFKGSAGADAWPCRGEVVLLMAAAELAPYLADDDELEDLADGRCRLRIGAWSWAALAATIARFDAEVEVVRPDALRTAFAELAARAARAAGTAAASGTTDRPAEQDPAGRSGRAGRRV